MKTDTEDKLANARAQGQAQFDSIRKMVEKVRRLEALTDQHGTAWHGKSVREDGISLKDACERIQEDALSVQVRSPWYTPGECLPPKPEEYEILLCTGEPACRIVGELSEHGEPSTAVLEVQDCFTPWTAIRPALGPDNYDSEPILLEYARQFYFWGVRDMITTQKELHRVFWQAHPHLSRKKIRNYSGNGTMHVTDTRCAWCDFVDAMSRDDQISQELAQRATLD